jgi:hypothetical protein
VSVTLFDKSVPMLSNPLFKILCHADVV